MPDLWTPANCWQPGAPRATKEIALINSKIRLASGSYFDLANPDPDLIDIKDIANSLANQCRFTGHVMEFYSVAQHSVLVSQLCSPQNELWGLLHDASEAYTGDLSTKMKQLFPQFRVFEERIQRAVCEKFKLPFGEPPEVVIADRRMLMTEVRDLFLHGPQDVREWAEFASYETDSRTVSPLRPREAYSVFLARFNNLMGKHK